MSDWKQRNKKAKLSKRDSILEKIAKVRNISDINKFLNPSKDSLHDPFLLKDIDKASTVIIDAILKQKRIAISADCDSDGIFSTAMMYRYLKQFTDNVYYVYSQRSEGHGVENQLDFIESRTDLLIILDSSTNSVGACKELIESGVENIVILDHHNVETENSYSVIVNPQGDNYPNKQISGAGVTFKTMQVIDEKLSVETAWDYIDLCGMGMYADMMDVSIPENRYIISQAMKNINNLGLKSILDLKNIELDSVNSQTIGFIISPIINGVARLDKIELALSLLTSDDEKECLILASEMIELNEKRKLREKELVDAYMSQINEDDKIIIATDKNASKGFNGLVATKLSQQYHRPSMVLRDHKGSLYGSYRTYGDFNMQKFLRDSKMVNMAEGHWFAGGVSMFKKELDRFKKYIEESLKNTNFETGLVYDLEISSYDITEDVIVEVEQFNYLTGQGCPPAIFKITDLFVDERVVMGKNRDTIKVKCDGIDLMKFKTDESYGNDIYDMCSIEVVGQLNLNVWTRWSGEEVITKQVYIEDYKVV